MCNIEKFYLVYILWLNDISYVNYNLLVNLIFVFYLINKVLD